MVLLCNEIICLTRSIDTDPLWSLSVRFILLLVNRPVTSVALVRRFMVNKILQKGEHASVLLFLKYLNVNC